MSVKHPEDEAGGGGSIADDARVPEADGVELKAVDGLAALGVPEIDDTTGMEMEGAPVEVLFSATRVG